jgi:hypothetical protein
VLALVPLREIDDLSPVDFAAQKLAEAGVAVTAGSVARFVAGIDSRTAAGTDRQAAESRV